MIHKKYEEVNVKSAADELSEEKEKEKNLIIQSVEAFQASKETDDTKNSFEDLPSENSINKTRRHSRTLPWGKCLKKWKK